MGKNATRKMNKKTRRIVLTVIIIVAVIFISGFMFALKAYFYTIDPPNRTSDFSSVIRDNVDLDTKVTDIAMLGAHDAFSAGNNKNSTYDTLGGEFFANDAAMFFASGFFVRWAKAQVSSIGDLLRRGVRYFDTRITVFQNDWYTHHVVISDRLEIYIVELIDFLAENPGEMVIFDIQWAYFTDNTFYDLFESMKNYQNSDGLSITDFIHHDPYNDELGDLRLRDITENGTKAGLIMTAKTDEYEGCIHYNYFESVRSVWHNKILTREILSGIKREYDDLTANPGKDRGKIRVNQTQLTCVVTLTRTFNTIFSWSLLDIAETHNLKIVHNEDFEKWLNVMPIYMVDYSDASHGNFNIIANEKINAFNAKNKS